MTKPEQQDIVVPGTTAGASAVMETVLLLMQTIRVEMRGHRPAGLSVPQMRVLTFIRGNDGASLSSAAEHVGVALSSMSKLVDGLVARELVTRTAAPEDRRRVILRLTTAGHATLAQSHDATLTRLAERLDHLTPDEQNNVFQAMNTLTKLFTDDPPATGD